MGRKKKNVYISDAANIYNIEEHKFDKKEISNHPSDNDKFEEYLDMFQITTGEKRIHSSNFIAHRNFKHISKKYTLEQLQQVMLNCKAKGDPYCTPEYFTRLIVIVNNLNKPLQNKEKDKILQDSNIWNRDFWFRH